MIQFIHNGTFLFRGTMITREEHMEIKVYLKQGKSLRWIAKYFGISRNTVKKYRDSDKEEPSYKERNSTHSILDDYKIKRKTLNLD